MYLNRYYLRNFRRLENVEINLEEEETIFVGANNSGKTSATAAFRLFVFPQRGEFRIHDFSSPLVVQIDDFGKNEHDENGNKLPNIELDLWFTVSPSTEYGRVAHFLPNVALETTEVGVRICFSVDDPVQLHEDYCSMFPKITSTKGNSEQKTMSYFLSQSDNLKKYFSLKYFRLERTTESVTEAGLALHAMKKDEGQKTLDSLLRVDFVEAQRNIADNDSVRSNRLSTVFADYYKHHLKQQENDAESMRVVEESNSNLTVHYEKEFKPLIKVIRGLGFPALNDRILKIISNLSPEKALSGNTVLTYFEEGTNHQLPEAYNGLGFKNLIYIAIQIAHFQIQWTGTEKNRPLCHLVFIEEPEVHLHTQVQQTFIRRIREVMKEIITGSADSKHTPQLVLTTHSSHIIAESGFQAIRYFRRVNTKPSEATAPPKNTKNIASEVLNLANFDKNNNEPMNLAFLRKYLKLTHCDLFFADAAILVEGSVERLLMPQMIKFETPELESAYFTNLELGGAYAHRFTSLLDFIHLPTLVITDLDSVDPAKNNKACRADTPNAVSSNASIKQLLLNKKDKMTKEEKTRYEEKLKVSSLIKFSSKNKDISSNGSPKYVTFQQAVAVPDYGNGKTMTPRTFEEAFIYENISAIRESKIKASIHLPAELDYENDYTLTYETVNAKSFKKVEFALNQIETDEVWITPAYIVEGLKWLRNKLELSFVDGTNNNNKKTPSSKNIENES